MYLRQVSSNVKGAEKNLIVSQNSSLNQKLNSNRVIEF